MSLASIQSCQGSNQIWFLQLVIGANHGNALEKINENPENYILGPPNSEKNTNYYEVQENTTYATK